MKALCWHGKSDMRCETVPDPKIEHPRDAIIKVTACAICGSDLHIYRRRHSRDGEGRRPRPRDHGRGRRGRVATTRSSRSATASSCPSRSPAANASSASAASIPAASAPIPIARRPRSCGAIRRPACSAIRICWAAIAGGQAEYLRVPFADVGPIKVPEGLSDEQVLFLSDIFPTGYMAADFCNIKGGDTIAIWGCGPVGQFAIRSAFLLGAERVIAIDTVPERLALAQGCRRRDARFHEGGYLRPHPGADQRPRRRRLHRCRRHRAAHDGELRFRHRPGQGRDLHGHRPAACAAPGDPLLPQLRHGLDRRRLWRLPRQDPDGLGHQSRPHLPHGADAGAALPAEAAGAHREGRDRSVLRHHRTARRSRMGRSSTRHSATRRTAASRSS